MRLAFPFAFFGFFFSCLPLSAGPDADFSAAVATTRSLASEITSSGLLPGLSIALVDGQRVAWAEGFGFADLDRRTPASPATAYRVGSISKLFTAIALLQLVERGKVDLARPLAEYLPDLGIENPFLAGAGPVLLRQVPSHVAGLPREPAIGSYFDGSGATPADALRSVRGATLVHPPGRVLKYSNLGVSLLGSVIERASGETYSAYQEKHVLGPLGMRSSAFTREARIAAVAATGYMQNRDRTLWPAPTFELGTIAAGNLYSTVEDLARFARMLHAGGEIEGRKIIEASTLERMFEKQFPEAGSFGIGFVVGERFGEKSVEHSGAVYGFSSSFICLPGAKLTAIILANEDVAMGPLRRLAGRLIGGALAARRGEAPPPEPPAGPVDLARFPAGPLVFRSDAPSPRGASRIEIRVEGGHAVLVIEGHAVRLAGTGSDAFITRDRLLEGVPVVLERGSDGVVTAVTFDKVRFAAFDPSKAPPAPGGWEPLTGHYGPSYLPVKVRVREGRLVAECETFEYELVPRPAGQPGVDPEFVFPRGTMYEDEVLRFHRGADGKAVAITLGTMRFERIPGR
jgi:serine beta-lactamase-like protein LACTB